MITNERQYKISVSQVQNFKESLKAIETQLDRPSDIHPILWESQKGAIEFQLNSLVSEIEEYQNLKSGKVLFTEIHDLKELPLVLIKARIANGYTQEDFAKALGIKPQQVQRYEAEKYGSASLNTLTKVASVLDLKVNAEIQIHSDENAESFNFKNYPFRDMLRRGWFGNFVGSMNDAATDAVNLLEKLFEDAGESNLKLAFNKKSIRIGSDVNTFALKAWYARVVVKAKHQQLQVEFDKNIINDTWLNSLAKLSKEADGVLKALKFVKESGIRVVIERHLEGTLLDGAALLLDETSPVIALTLRYDRIDNFWFVLFHEIAHVKLHLGGDINVIFDDLDKHTDGIEKEADEFGMNGLVPEHLWSKSLVRFRPTDESITNFAKSLGIHPAIIAGRIRRETGRYYLFPNLVGQGLVRKQLQQEI
jgi:HTH-type transcriptional regulator/antitoxin HigA